MSVSASGVSVPSPSQRTMRTETLVCVGFCVCRHINIAASCRWRANDSNSSLSGGGGGIASWASGGGTAAAG